MCSLSSEVPDNILSCSHGYHIECLVQANQKCPHCYEYLHDDVKYQCKVFQNMLSKAFDDIVDEDGEDLEDHEDLQKNNIDEIISVKDDIDKKLKEALKSFRYVGSKFGFDLLFYYLLTNLLIFLQKVTNPLVYLF